MNNNKGFTLLEFLGFMAIVAFIAVLSVQSQKVDSDMAKARNMGIKLLEYNQAVSRFISINTANSELRNNVGDDNVTYNGIDWLRSVDCNEAGLADRNYLPCDFTDGLDGISNTSFRTRLDFLSNSEIKATTFFDFSDDDFGNGRLVGISESMLGLAALTAMGGDDQSVSIDENDIGSSIDGDGNPTTRIFLGMSNSQYLYCPMGLDEDVLNDNCTVDGANKENGFLIALSSTESSRDSWLRTDGSNSMNNRFTLNEESSQENREIRFVNRLYNIVGETLKIGNSEIYNEGVDSFTPILGSGVVFDTDSYITGSLENDLNISAKGDIYSDGDLITEMSVIGIQGVSTDGNLDAAGDLLISGTGLVGEDARTIGKLDTNSLYANSFVEAQNYYVMGSVISEGQSVTSSPTVRASELLISDTDVSVNGIATIEGNSFIETDQFVQGNYFIDSNLAVEDGATFLSDTYMDMMIDNDGDYILDPSNISLFEVLRTNAMAPTLQGDTMVISANAINFGAENIDCGADTFNPDDSWYRDNCGTKMEGYVDMAQVRVKSPADGAWVSFLDILNGFDEYNSDGIQTIYDVNEELTSPIQSQVTGYSCNGTNVGTVVEQSDVSNMESRGWSCDNIDNQVNSVSGEREYLCETSCAVPTPPVSECQPDGYLEDSVVLRGDDSNVPSNWDCSQTGVEGGVPVYTCDIQCEYEEPEPEPEYERNLPLYKCEQLIDLYGVDNLPSNWGYLCGYWFPEYVTPPEPEPELVWGPLVFVESTPSFYSDCPGEVFRYLTNKGYNGFNNTKEGACVRRGQTHGVAKLDVYGGGRCQGGEYIQRCGGDASGGLLPL